MGTPGEDSGGSGEVGFHAPVEMLRLKQLHWQVKTELAAGLAEPAWARQTSLLGQAAGHRLRSWMSVAPHGHCGGLNTSAGHSAKVQDRTIPYPSNNCPHCLSGGKNDVYPKPNQMRDPPHVR